MVLFKIFGLPVHGYGLMLAIAFIVAIFGVSKVAKKEGIKVDDVIDLAIWVIIGAVVGARIAFVISELQYFSRVPWWNIFLVNSGGLAFQGGLIGGFLAGFLFVKSKKIYPWKLADIVAPFIALGYSIVRIGCLMNGCCYGKVTNLPWALRCSANDTLLRHPTQIYSMIGSFIIFTILWRMRHHRHFAGFLFLLYVGLYSIERFIVEFFRENPMALPWLSWAQVVCIVFGITAFGLMWFLLRQERKGRIKVDAAAEAHR